MFKPSRDILDTCGLIRTIRTSYLSQTSQEPARAADAGSSVASSSRMPAMPSGQNVNGNSSAIACKTDNVRPVWVKSASHSVARPRCRALCRRRRLGGRWPRGRRRDLAVRPWRSRAKLQGSRALAVMLASVSWN